MSSIILEIKNLTKVYKDKSHTVKALDGVNLSLNRGEIFGLLGVNGAGKTTLSSIIATLHPPTSGTILFNGVSIYDDLMNYRRSLGYCPQTQNLDQFLTVRENLVFAGRYFLMPKELIAQRVQQLMEELDLTKYADFEISSLSGGTRQRVLIARALMPSPAIVLLDEPTVGLDPDIRRKLWDLILDLRNKGITIILTTHYLDEAEVLSDRICILNKGKVLMVESVQTLRERHQMDRLEDIFLTLAKEGQLNRDVSKE